MNKHKNRPWWLSPIDMKEQVETVMIVEINDYLMHILPLIQSFSEYDDMSLNDILVDLLEKGTRQCHPYFQIYHDDYHRIQPCKSKDRLKLV